MIKKSYLLIKVTLLYNLFFEIRFFSFLLHFLVILSYVLYVFDHSLKISSLYTLIYCKDRVNMFRCDRYKNTLIVVKSNKGDTHGVDPNP